MGRPEFWSPSMDFCKDEAEDWEARMVDLAPWEAKTRAMSTIGIWWPPPTKGKKYISTVGDDGEEAMVVWAKNLVCELKEHDHPIYIVNT